MSSRAIVGNGAVLVPLILIAGGAHMLRQAPEPQGRGRVIVGSLALTIAVLGLRFNGSAITSIPTADR